MGIVRFLKALPRLYKQYKEIVHVLVILAGLISNFMATLHGQHQTGQAIGQVAATAEAAKKTAEGADRKASHVLQSLAPPEPNR